MQCNGLWLCNGWQAVHSFERVGTRLAPKRHKLSKLSNTNTHAHPSEMPFHIHQQLDTFRMAITRAPKTFWRYIRNWWVCIVFTRHKVRRGNRTTTARQRQRLRQRLRQRQRQHNGGVNGGGDRLYHHYAHAKKPNNHIELNPSAEQTQTHTHTPYEPNEQSERARVRIVLLVAERFFGVVKIRCGQRSSRPGWQ